MKHQFIRLVSASVLLILLLAGLGSTTARAGATAEEICEGNGAIWAGSDASNGNCFYQYDNPVTISECGAGGSSRIESYTADALTFGICGILLNPQVEFTAGSCPLWRGEFSGDGTNGSCTIPHDYFGDCPGTTIYYGTVVLTNYETTHFECVAGGGSGSSGSSGRNPGYGKYGGKIVNEAAGSAALGGNKNGSFYYDAGTCTIGCIYTPSLPGKAANSLPDDAVATLYVRLAEDGTGSYTVCFDVSGIANPVIYRYISGAWVAQPISFSGGQACTTASGDGAFALGG